MSRSTFKISCPPVITALGFRMFNMAFRAILEKYAEAELKHHWQDAWARVDADVLRTMLYDHIEKGDAKDVAVIACMMVWHGYSTAPDKGCWVKIASRETKETAK